MRSVPEPLEISRNPGKLQQDLRRDPGICRIGASGMTENRNNRTGVRIAGWMLESEPGKLRWLFFPVGRRESVWWFGRVL